jgi:hypothetical protein
MNIQNTYATTQTTAPIVNLTSVAQSSNSPSSVPPAATGSAATASISTPAQFFNQLQQLSQQDPTQFKAVASQLATSFQNAASQASGPQAKALNNLANQLDQAAQTGQLQPPQSAQGAAGSSQAGGGYHHHHHHGGGGSASGQSSEVQQAFQTAVGILDQALQTTPSSTSTSST